MTPDARRILVVANETVGGRNLIDAVKRHADAGPVKITVICPQNEPKHGYVVYEDSQRQAAENRLKTTLAQLREAGIEAEGEVMDPDPYTAVKDAIDHYGADEVIVSTHPETRSGWMRKGLVDRIAEDTGLPVEHVVVDLDVDRAESTHTLVVANQTIEGEKLFERLKAKAAESPHRFIVICPQTEDAPGDAAERLAHVLKNLQEAGLEAVGQVTHPDPFTAVQNALQFYRVDDIVISTFEDERSGWMRSDLIERIESTTSAPVEHVIVTHAEMGV